MGKQAHDRDAGAGDTLERGFGKRPDASSRTCSNRTASTVHGADELERFEGDGRVGKVLTTNGLDLPAEAVVVGAGVTPDVALARSAPGCRSASAAECCAPRAWRARRPGVFAAGDICEYDSVRARRPAVRIEHWDVAFNHGKTAALNMLGGDVPHEVVPYFYSVLGDWGELEYVGPAYEWDEEIVRGSYDDGEFTNWYLKDGAGEGRAHVRSLRRSGPRTPADRRRRAVLDSTRRRASRADSRTSRCDPGAMGSSQRARVGSRI